MAKNDKIAVGVPVGAQVKQNDEGAPPNPALNDVKKEQTPEEKAERCHCAVSPKGALSLYGLGRFPVTLYVGQWDVLLAAIPKVQEFIAQNRGRLAQKVKTEEVQG